MLRSCIRTLAAVMTMGACLSSLAPSRADCQPQDLTVVLNTGWDESTGTVIPANTPDDDWDVTSLPSGSISPIDAGVINANPAWLTMPNSAWISAYASGLSGLSTYRTCWCMDDDFSSPNMNFAIRADDQADVFVNGTLVLSLPGGTFNDALALGMSVNPALLHAGTNCLEVVVDNVTGPTGFNLVGTVTATGGLCCGCLETDIQDDASSGADDSNGGLIATGLDDDEWVVTASASGGVLPRPADVIDTFMSWHVIPFTKWISADEDGPNGHYVYQKCWCMNPEFQNAALSMALLADNQATVFLNGTPIGSTPPNAFLFPPTSITTGDQSLFKPGKNCVTIDVTNTSGVVTGLDVDMTISAVNAECCPCTELPPDAEGWWPLDETLGPTAGEVLNGHDGTWLELSGLPPSPFSLEDLVNRSLVLDGNDDYVEVPDHPGLDFEAGQDFSFDAWIKSGRTTREAILFKKEPGLPSAPGYAFYTAGVLTLEIADGGTFLICNGVTNVSDDDWHFVAATVDRAPGEVTLYVDGMIDKVCPLTSVAGSLANDEPLFFGAAPLNPVSARLWWKGQLDEIEIFRRELTEDEVDHLHGAGSSGKCPPESCEDSAGDPVCAGACPTGSTCVTGPPPASACECVPDASSCEGSSPVCEGFCPASQDVCVPNGPNCFCVPPPQCGGPGDHPACNGACPEGLVCENTGNVCACVEDVVPCSETSYPECGGSCPPGEACENIVGTNFCECQPAPIDCEDALYPACNGACPVNQVCKPGPNQNCACVACGTGVPIDPSGPIVVTLPAPDAIRWTPVTCALVYNVYRGSGPRLFDQNDDGLADDYGSCHLGDIIGNDLEDPGRPQAGGLFWYLVTAENFAGEGPLGENSSGQSRQATSVCP